MLATTIRSVEAAIQAVIPILPAAQSLLVVLSLLGLAGVSALWSLRHPAAWRTLARLMWRQKLALLALVGIAYVLVALVTHVQQLWFEHNSPPLVMDGSWMSRGSLSRAACADEMTSPRRGGIRWAGGDEYTFYSSPAVVGECVYVIGLRGDRGRVFCWHVIDGRLLWSSEPAGMRATFSSPVISGRYLVCGEGLHHTPRCRVFCLDLAPGSTGNVLWTFETNSHVECTPVIDGDRVYVTAGDDGLYCLRLSPEVADEDRVVWHRSGDEYPDAETSLAVHNGVVYVGLGEGGKALCRLNAKTGDEIDRLALPFPVFSPPTIADDRLYVAMGQGNYATHHDNPAGQICCLDIKTGNIDWAFPTPASVLGAVAVDRGEVIAACADGRLYVLNCEGELLNTWNSRAPIVTAPAVSDDTIYFVNTDGVLYGLDRRTLQPVWDVRLGEPSIGYISSPVVAQGQVFVGTPGDGLLSVGELRRASSEHRSSPFAEALPDQGHVLWTFPLDPDESLSAPIAVSDRGLVMAVESPQSAALVCLENRGDLMPRECWRVNAGRIKHPFAVHGGMVVVATESPGRLQALDVGTGQLLWETPLDAVGPPMAIGNSCEVLCHSAKAVQSEGVVVRETRSLVDGALLESVRLSQYDANLRLHPAGLRANKHQLLIPAEEGGGDATIWADLSHWVRSRRLQLSLAGASMWGSADVDWCAWVRGRSHERTHAVGGVSE